MTDLVRNFTNVVTTIIHNEFPVDSDVLPTIAQIEAKADEVREQLKALYPLTDEDMPEVKKLLASEILHSIGVAVTLHGHDPDHQSWYFNQENDNYFWNRYRKYLLDFKHWSIEVVNRLHITTNDIMDDLGNPKDYSRPFQRRGLLLGDVQSGKTATYTAICNKAADAGYRVIIVLAGTMENLRVQTQSRLDAEFVGKESKYALDRKAEKEIRNTPVGVGKITPRNDKNIACFTSVQTDFNKAILKANNLNLRMLDGTALFVIKKNKSVLHNLYQWLMENTSDPSSQLIDLPLLLIDDEADNASVNTSSDETKPTAINKEIRSILGCFKFASYLGITATPFANIFIDPEPDNDTKDLFPKDFLTVLPTPDNYIGADRIFGNGDADDWSEESAQTRVNGEYSNSIIPIYNTEQVSYFYFKHKKEIADYLSDLPNSLHESIRYFMLATAISDYRKDVNEHRSMLVNVSRFTMVQNTVADLVESYVHRFQSDLENYSQLSLDKAEQIDSIAALKGTWDKHDLGAVSQTTWDNILHNYLFKSVRRITVRSVNQQHGASSLDYYSYKDTGMRVIAVGGNSLSRGLTLEGLCVSYFYRNTMMYDTLLQMGRWFGYRYNYDDLFRIWMAEDAIEWFGYITDAVNELKDELKKMKRQKLTPEQFGLKVRQAPGTLLITARNKMRTATLVSRPITVSGRMIETPRLKNESTVLHANERLCNETMTIINTEICKWEKDSVTNSIIWRNVPKAYVIDLVRNFVTHPWNLNFQSVALADYISDSGTSLELWDVAIPQGSCISPIEISLGNEKVSVNPEMRQVSTNDGAIKKMLQINGRHVRVGTGGCSKIGLSEEQIKSIRSQCKRPNDKAYLSDPTRKPLLLIHIIKSVQDEECKTNEIPDYLYALSLGFPYDGEEREANYMVNINELKNWIDYDDEYDDDED